VNLDELRAVQAGERNTDSLQSLRDSFYRDVAEYINGLREERARAAERADDPFGSEEVRHLTDEIETAQEVAEAIYDRRLGKVVKRASLAAAGMPTDEKGLTDEEAALFAEVVGKIESRRDAVLSAFAGEAEVPTTDLGDDSGAGAPDVTPDSAGLSGDAGAPDPTAAVDDGPPVSGSSGADDQLDPEPAGREPADPTHDAGGAAAGGGFAASEAMGGGMDGESPPEGPPTDERSDRRADERSDRRADERSDRRADERSDRTEEDERADASEATPDGGRLAADRATVRITRDVGEIMGVDEHVYELADGDVVTLPSANAEPLLERDAASRIE
jgi:DNA replication factor GINS